MRAILFRNGAVDTAFDPGAGANNTVYSVLLLPDSNFLIGGDFTAVNGVSRNRIARIKADDLGPRFLSVVFTQVNPTQLILMSQGGRAYILEARPNPIEWG